MSTQAPSELDAQYRQVREACGVTAPEDVCLIAIEGEEAAEYLQGQVTNDVEALSPGTGCYAALLDRKAHFQADMRVLRTSTGFLLTMHPDAGDKALKHLSMYKIGRDVSVEDRSDETRIIHLVGPKLEEACGHRSGPEGSHQIARIGGAACIAVSAALGQVPAIELLVESESAEQVHAYLMDSGAEPVDQQALEVLRIEAAIPRFGKEITADRMPAEVGVVDRAVSFTKGCYIGQEPVARLHYRGQPNRMLCSLELDRPLEAGTTLFAGDKEVGELSSVAISPATGIRGLAVLRKEAQVGVELSDGSGTRVATVVARHDGSGE